MSNHAWCHDIARDAAVRAAEDGRTAPLPTLGECIDGMFPKSVSATSPVEHENKGDGMRTERVTLEITRPAIANYPAPARQFMWQHLLRDVVQGDRESVRVVEDKERQAPPTTKTATTENDYVPPAPVSRPAETRQTKAERVGSGWWFPKYDKPSALPPPPPAPPRVHRGSGVFDASGDEVPWEGVVATLTAERDAAIRERDELRKSWLRSEESGTRLLAQRNAALDDADELRKQVAELKDKSHARWVSMNKFLSGFAETRCERDALRARVAELEAASGGGDGEVANVTFHAGDSAERARYVGMTVKPLRKPQPRGWLTQEERELIAGLTDDDDYTEEGQNIAKGLLARSTPPEVVLPDADCSWCSDYATVWRECLDAVRSSLAAAGVVVKEVQ